MKPRLHLSLVVAVALSGTALLDCLRGTSQKAWAQSSGGSSRSDGGRDSDRDHSRSRFGDRSRGDWRSSRSRDEEHRSDDRRRDDRGSSSSSGSSSSGSNSSSSSRSTGSSSTSSSTSTPTPSSSSSSSASSNERLKKWATELVTKNDKNGDMILDKDEQAALGSSAASEDLNHDGKITIDEIVMHHSSGTSTSPTASSSSSSTPSSSSDSSRSSSSDSRSKTSDALAKRVLTGTAGGTGKDADKRRSYRFSKASDKLPTGLPSYFSRDTNHDGQVSLSEYSRSMSSSVVAEFRRYDLNDDGFITAKEAIKK